MKQMKVTIDRFEGDFAVVELENKTMVNFPKCLLPPDAKEYDVICIALDRTQTTLRKERIDRLANELFED